jgi:hypothetical protein
MALTKDPKTGKFILSTAKAIQKHRSRRRKYVKHNLRPRGSGLLDWIVGLFDFSRDPFKGSPIASHIGKQKRLIQACCEASASQMPVDEHHHLALQIRSGLQDHLSDAETDADEFLDVLDTDLLQEEAFLDECRPELISSNLAAEFRQELDAVETAFGPLASRAAESKIHLDNFRNMHGLPKTFYWGGHFTTGNIGLIMGIVVFEFVLNSIFFASANPLGLLGGGALALVLSIATIVLGVFYGIAYQFNHRRSEGGGWVGKVMLGVVTLAALFYLLLLTLARLAGEAGDLMMFRTAAETIKEAPFSGLLDLPSLGYFLFSIGVILYTAFKYVSIMGRFPGLRRRVIQAEQAEADYDTEAAAAADHFRSAATDHIEALNSLPFFIQSTVLPIKNVEMEYENVIDQFRNDCKSIGNSSRLLFSYVNSNVPNSQLDVHSFANTECATAMESHNSRLAELREDVEKLVSREEIKPDAVDRCRTAMSDMLQASVEALARRCTEIKDARYTEKRAEIGDPS